MNTSEIQKQSEDFSVIARRYEEYANQHATVNNEDASWSFVMLYYASLHLFNSVLVRCGFSPNEQNVYHKIREKIVDECLTGLEDVSKHYKTIKIKSVQVRYYGKVFNRMSYEKYFLDYYQELKNKVVSILQDPSFPLDEQIERVKEKMTQHGR